MTCLAGPLGDWPLPIRIAFVIVGFVFWWPLGLALAACLLWRANMGCCGFGFGAWRDDAGRQAQERRAPPPGGSHAFDEYRAETLRRLEQEQQAFRDFLSRLRMAKDKAELDQFMAQRRGAAQGAGPPQSA